MIYWTKSGILTITAVMVTACGGGDSAPKPVSQMPTVPGASEARPSTPVEYAGKTNPLSGPAVVSAGKDIYQTNCVSCHGDSGKGDGVASAALKPKPQDLTVTKGEDDYLFWRISEGGMMDPFNSVMPSWKDVLSEEERWQVIAYIHSLHVE